MGAAVSAGSEKSSAPAASVFQIHPSPTTPDFVNGSKVAEPNYGFDGQKRKEREPPVTQEELISAKVPPHLRDFCAHKFIAFAKCKKDKFPFMTKCHHARHDYEHCQYEETILRMKEYERERRLLIRKQRKEEKAKKQQEC